MVNDGYNDESDVPMDGENSMGEDLPLSEDQLANVKKRPKQVEQMYRGQAALLKADVDDTGIIEAYNSLDPLQDPKLTVNQLAMDRAGREQRELKEYFEQNLGGTPDDVIVNIEAYQQLSREYLDKQTPERQVLESVATADRPKEEDISSAEAELMVINVLTDTIDDYGKFEKALDIGKMFLPTSIVDNIQVTGSAFSADDYLRDVIVGLKDLKRNSPNQFAKVFPALLQEIQKDLPKNKQIQILSALVDPRGEEELDFFGPLDAALDLVDIVGVTAGAAASGLQARRAKRAEYTSHTRDDRRNRRPEDVTPPPRDVDDSIIEGEILEAEEAVDNGDYARQQADSAFRTNRQREEEKTAAWSSLARGLVKTTTRLTNQNNAPRLANKMNNKDVASDITALSLIDETTEVAEKAGITKDTAYNNAAPFNMGDLDEAYASGLSAKTVERIDQVKRKQREVAEYLRSKRGLLKEGLLTPDERLAREERFYGDMKKMGLDNINVIHRDDVTTTFKYSVADPETGDVLTDTMQMNMDISDVTGLWKNTEQHMLGNFLTSPTVFAQNSIDAVESSLRMDSTSAPLAVKFKQLQTEALAPILGGFGKSLSPKARKQLAELDSVLLAGDSFRDASTNVKGKVYTPEELRGGVVDGIQLSDAQIETYYNLRNLYDNLWDIRNYETRNTMIAQGLREVNINGVGPTIGKPYTREAAKDAIGMLQVYDATTDSIKNVRSSNIDKMYDEGHVLARLQEPMVRPGTTDLYDTVIVSPSSVRELPSKVLSYREGYVPKVNKGAYWFVKQTGTRVVNGITKSGQVLKTVRMFASKTEAQKWLDKNNELGDLTLLPDRALEQQVYGSSQVGSGGGLYTGSRAQEDIPFGPEGLPAERLNTYEALSVNLMSLEKYVTRNQWRMGMQQRWINSAQAAGFDEVTTFNKDLIPAGDPRGPGLRRLAEQIEIWSGFPSKDELRWDGIVSGVMEWALNSRFTPLSDKTVVRGANFLRDTNPAGFLRSMSFHHLLGMFNPVQWWVQAQGAALAMSMNPENILDITRMQTAMLATSAAKKFGRTDVTELVAKMLMIPPDELVNITEALDRSGLMDSIKNNADYSAASRGFGITADAVRRAADSSLLFYRAGESYTRSYAFLNAALQKGKRTGTFRFSDPELKDVLADANRSMLELSSANKAAWQRGILGVPTQFFQVQAKFMESIFGVNNRFTLTERAKILTGQVMLYGTAGVPLGGLGVRYLTEALGMTQQDIDEMDPTTVEAINNGFWGVYANILLGGDVDISNRGALGAQMSEFYLDLIFAESTLGEKVSGAFGIIPQRYFQAIKTIKPMMLSDTEEPITREEILRGLDALASVSSTWNNAKKSIFMHNYQQLLDTRGNVIAEGPFDDMTIFLTALGLQPADLRRIREMDNLSRARKEYRNGVVNDLVNHYWDYTRAYNGADNDKERDMLIERYAAGTRMLMRSLKNEGERNAVREALNNRLSNPGSKKEKVIKKFIDDFADGQVLEAGNMAAAARAAGIIQVAPTQKKPNFDHLQIQNIIQDNREE